MTDNEGVQIWYPGEVNACIPVLESNHPSLGIAEDIRAL